MNKCIWCNKEIIANCSVSQLLTFKKLDPQIICEDCELKFDPIEMTKCCPNCHRKQMDQLICQDCLKWQKKYPSYFLKHDALYSYNEFGKKWMERFKFTGDVRVAKMVAEKLSKAIKRHKEVDIIIPIPISNKSFENRGFNQTEILLNIAEVPFVTILENRSIEKNQVTKNRRERLNIVQPFFIKSELKDSVRGKNVMIIDDVYTTGRTILYSVECVFSCGARKVETLSLFR